MTRLSLLADADLADADLADADLADADEDIMTSEIASHQSKLLARQLTASDTVTSNVVAR